MADYRQIHTCIWKDSWFIELPQEYKLLFIYLFSNERANLTGLYDLSLRVVEFEANLDMNVITAGLEQFARDGKVFYEDGMIWLPTLMRHNARNITSPKIQTHIKGIISTTRDCPLKARWIEHYNASVPEAYRMDTLPIPMPEGREEHVPAPVPVRVPAPVQKNPPKRKYSPPPEEHPAIAIYREKTQMDMNDTQRTEAIGMVGIKPDSLTLWQSVIHGWLLKGWRSDNVGGMLDFFERKEVPGQDRATGPPGGDGRTPAQMAAEVAREFEAEEQDNG